MSTSTIPGAPTIGAYQIDDPSKPWSGLHNGSLDRHIAEWVRRIHAHGNATTDGTYRPANHFLIGVGAGHQDDNFAAAGTSHAAWFENDADGVFMDADREADKVERLQAKADASGHVDDHRAAIYQALRAAIAKAKTLKEM